MQNRTSRFAGIVFVVLAVFSLAAASEIVELGRPLRARSWLGDLDSVPSVMLPYDALYVANFVPRQAAHYRIDPEVKAEAYTYYFTVRSESAAFEAASVVNLLKLTHELAVIEELEEIHKGKEFASGVADGVKGIGTGLKNLVTHPGQSVKGVGERLRKTGRSLERAVGAEESVGRDESGRDRAHLGAGPAGQSRRALAYQFGVDVYTRNPVLQRILVDLSRVYTAGTFATWAIPYHIGALDYFNPLSGDDATERRIRDYPPDELRRLVGQELEPLFGMNREDPSRPLRRWLMNPNYSPRQTAYIGEALKRFSGAGNIGLVLGNLSEASTPEEADMLTLEIRLYGLLDANVVKVVDFAKYRGLFLGKGADGVMYALFPGDTLRPWGETERGLDDLLREASRVGMRGVAVWSVGDIHPDLVGMMEGLGVQVRQHILHDENFYRQPK